MKSPSTHWIWDGWTGPTTVLNDMQNKTFSCLYQELNLNFAVIQSIHRYIDRHMPSNILCLKYFWSCHHQTVKQIIAFSLESSWSLSSAHSGNKNHTGDPMKHTGVRVPTEVRAYTHRYFRLTIQHTGLPTVPPTGCEEVELGKTRIHFDAYPTNFKRRGLTNSGHIN
jgi:hypothetical protein